MKKIFLIGGLAIAIAAAAQETSVAGNSYARKGISYTSVGNFTAKESAAPLAINYADDLLQFQSYEQLVAAFGESNIKKDLYYFSSTEFSPCSVLYPGTSRQAIFIWNDAVNDQGLQYVVLGGCLQSAVPDSQAGKTSVIWTLKNNVRPGMTVAELRQLNGADFKIYGGATEYSGFIMPENKGSINFAGNVIVVAADGAGNQFNTKQFISADKAIKEGMALKVYSIMLYPNK